MIETQKEVRRRSRPIDCTPKQLKRVGLTVLNVHKLWLACDACGRRWYPSDLSGRRLPNGYWKCPNRCNESH